jgi:hypothetical protein
MILYVNSQFLEFAKDFSIVHASINNLIFYKSILLSQKHGISNMRSIPYKNCKHDDRLVKSFLKTGTNTSQDEFGCLKKSTFEISSCESNIKIPPPCNFFIAIFKGKVSQVRWRKGLVEWESR